MQNLSASDLLSLDLGFHTAREDNDDNESGACKPDHRAAEAAKGSLLAYDSEHDKVGEVGELGAAGGSRRVSSTGASRANRWRLGETRSGRLGGDREAGTDSWGVTGVDAAGANNDRSAARIGSKTGDQQEGRSVAVGGGSRHPTSSDASAESTRARISIRIDICADDPQSARNGHNEERERPAGETASTFHIDQPPREPARASSSVELRSLGAESTSYWHGSPMASRAVQSSEQDLLLLSVQARAETGSLSDGAYKLTKYCRPSSAKAALGLGKQRFDSWKRSNKLITNIRDNPFNLHLDCLDRLDDLGEAGERGAPPEGKLVREQTTQTVEEVPPGRGEPASDLSNYANNLTHLYRANRESMDSSRDFRALLYNVICCLLVQDEQVLATASVGKMLDVIRTHLDSASRVYANTSNRLLSNLQSQHPADAKTPHTASPVPFKSSSGCPSTISVDTLAASSLTPRDGSLEASQLQQRDAPVFGHHLAQQPDPHLSQKPANFRRISSVSYNDEQLIKDLRDGEPHGAGVRRSDSLSSQAGPPSPWAYRELSERRQSVPKLDSAGSSCLTAHYTSQSSLEQANQSDGPQNELMNDSGNGTMCDSQVVSDYGAEARHQRRDSAQSGQRAASLCCDSFQALAASTRRARPDRRLSDFKPMQQPSYMSTDDYLSTTNHYNQRTSIYDDDNSSTLQRCDLAFNQSKRSMDESLHEDGLPADVAGRREELEWTLNKLINIELKLKWLTSKDTLRRAIRKIGVPNEIRGKVWLILIDQMIGAKYDAASLLAQANETIDEMDEKRVLFDDDTQAILKQIELDVNRTMPGHRLFDDGAEGGVKLRRILVAYSIHVNRAIAYCQGFNFIVALLLSVFEGDETQALRGFVCIVDHIFPSKYYFDHYLTGARADQFLLADFICDQLIKSPTMAERKMVEGVTSSITLNWFISLFHGAVPTLTRLTILDHFMLEGVKALFRFTMAILYLAFQVAPPSSCEVFTAIRNTAKDMYDIKLLLSIVDQIKLPKDSYFAIRRSFYMVQSSFNSDQFYMQTLSSEAERSLVANKPLSCQQLTKAARPPALSLIGQASFIASAASSGAGQSNQTGVMSSNQFTFKNSVCLDSVQRPRTRISADRSKICIQSIGKLGRSHLRVIDVSTRANERALMSPLRNCTLIGVSSCGKQLTMARQSAKRNYRRFTEQDLTFHVHEISTEIFDGFYLEEAQQALIITHSGEIFKIDCQKCAEDHRLAKPNYLDACTETLLLRDTGRGSVEHEKVKLRLSTMDTLTNLLWIYVECENYCELSPNCAPSGPQFARPSLGDISLAAHSSQTIGGSASIFPRTTSRFKFNNPFLEEPEDLDTVSNGDINNNSHYGQDRFSDKHPETNQNKPSFSRKIIIVDMITFDLFSVFTVHPNFGEIANLKASLVAFCQLSNPASSQFSTRIIQIGPTGRYEQLLSFSDVADYMVSLPESFKQKYHKQTGKLSQVDQTTQQLRYSSIRRFLTHSVSFSSARRNSSSCGQAVRNDDHTSGNNLPSHNTGSSSTLARYYRSLMRSYSTAEPEKQSDNVSDNSNKSEEWNASRLPVTLSTTCDTKRQVPMSQQTRKPIQDGALRSIISSSFGDFSELSETNYIPVNMAFIFCNGKIALFEFTESYAIHTREAQLDRYDYSRVVDVAKSGEDFIVTILTVCDKLIKVII